MKPKPSPSQMKVRKSRLRAIDTGTRYDVAGNLRRLARQIERGEEGEVRDAVIAWREIKNGGAVQVHLAHYGTGTMADCLYIWEAGKDKMV